jgi:hypothetical protein
MRSLLPPLTVCALVVLFSAPAFAQSDAPIGVRAAGMGGAFVAVSDDASAVFWNPAGLASGAYFSLLGDRNTFETSDDSATPRQRSGLLVALGTPPLGLSYYRTRTITRLGDFTQELVTDHAGLTLLHTIGHGVSIGGTAKYVHGVASRIEAPRDSALDVVDEVPGRSEDKFDADFGVLAATGTIKAGVQVRNAFEPKFDTLDGGLPIELERRIRAGVAMSLAPSLSLAVDADFTKITTSGGLWRDAAVGSEARLTRRAWARGGIHWNTAGGDNVGGAAPVGSVGGSFAVYGTLLADGQVSFGSKNGDRGWGLGARIVF